MRSMLPIAALLLLSLNSGALRASAASNTPPDPNSIDALEARAEQAQPRDQCFLYAKLVEQMTELSIHQYSIGDVDQANGLLRRVQRITQKFHLSLKDNDKRLKDAQVLLSRTAFRLGEMLQSSSVEERALVQQTLSQVTDAKNEALMEVFKK